MSLNTKGLFNPCWAIFFTKDPVSGVLATIVLELTCGGLTLFLSRRCCLTTIPVDTEVLAGT